MKLSELVTHTANWTGIARTVVESHSRYLREAGLITSGPRGLAAAEMNATDKITLLVAVLGCGTARTCAQDVPRLLALKANPVNHKSSNIDGLTFFKSDNLENALAALFDDLAKGRIDNWFSKTTKAVGKHFNEKKSSVEVTIRFLVDGDFASFNVVAQISTDVLTNDANLSVTLEQTFGHKPKSPLPGYSRREHEISRERLVGWGECLRD